MKRINIHIPGEDIETLQSYVKEIKSLAGGGYGHAITTAELIRFAISQTYGCKFTEKHCPEDVLRVYVKQAGEKLWRMPKMAMRI